MHVERATKEDPGAALQAPLTHGTGNDAGCCRTRASVASGPHDASPCADGRSARQQQASLGRTTRTLRRNSPSRNGTVTASSRVGRTLGAPRSRSAHARRGLGGARGLQAPTSQGVAATSAPAVTPSGWRPRAEESIEGHGASKARERSRNSRVLVRQAPRGQRFEARLSVPSTNRASISVWQISKPATATRVRFAVICAALGQRSPLAFEQLH